MKLIFQRNYAWGFGIWFSPYYVPYGVRRKNGWCFTIQLLCLDISLIKVGYWG